MRPLRWEDESLFLLDQTRLPREEVWLRCTTVEEVARAIEEMRVRGAPAIGATAAYGVALGARKGDDPLAAALAAAERLRVTRPTAVNLFWALERMTARARALAPQGPEAVRTGLLEEAHRIAEEDVATNRAIGRHGAELLPNPCRVLTHCNTGSLATVEYGTALGVIRTAWEAGKELHVWVDETRPFLQGARLTAWELQKLGIPYTLISDNMAGHFMQRGQVDAVIVGADRIAANGDTANKIGTYTLAVLCAHHGIPFYVAAPTTTVDLSLPSGEAIPIEERSAEEVTHCRGVPIAPEGAPAAHPAFDVTPAALITAIITEEGVIRPPFEDGLRRAVERARLAGRR